MMVTGTVVSILPDRRCGFVKVAPGAPHVFLAHSLLMGEGLSIEVGTRVEFDMFISPKGPRTSKVRIIEETPHQ